MLDAQNPEINNTLAKLEQNQGIKSCGTHNNHITIECDVAQIGDMFNQQVKNINHTLFPRNSTYAPKKER